MVFRSKAWYRCNPHDRLAIISTIREANVFVWPRQLIPVALLYILGIAAYRRDRSNDELLPLPSRTEAAVQPVDA